jgi:purine-binding chemotaxis protein CheW
MTDISNTKSANFDLSSLDLLDLSDPLFPEENALETKGEKYIVFFLDTETYAVPSNQVAEIFQPLAITPLPNTPSWLLGIANFRNEIISVVDLQKLWQKDTISLSPKAKLVVLRSEKGDSHIAFAIDKFNEIVSFPDESVQAIDDEGIPYVNGKTTHKSSAVNLIDASKILSLSF